MKTTALGIATIVAAIATAAVQFLKTGSCDILSLSTGLSAGYGLIKAADAKP